MNRASARSRAIEPTMKRATKSECGHDTHASQGRRRRSGAASAPARYRGRTRRGGRPRQGARRAARRAAHIERLPPSEPWRRPIRAVPRMYPPTWSTARRPPFISASRRQPSVVASSQSQALSPSISRKNVRNPPRMAIVTMLAAAADDVAEPAQDEIRGSRPRCVARIAASSDGTPSPVNWSRTVPIPASNAATMAVRDGTSAMTIAATAAPITRSAARETTPAALARPHPRARRSLTYGARVAARIRARMIDANDRPPAAWRSRTGPPRARA